MSSSPSLVSFIVETIIRRRGPLGHLALRKYSLDGNEMYSEIRMPVLVITEYHSHLWYSVFELHISLGFI